jgi:preprotein translocase subunit SecF
MALISLPHTFSISFIKNRFLPFILLGLMILATAISYITYGLNWGIDFRGGILVEAKFAHKIPDLHELRKNLKHKLMRECSIQELGKSDNTILIRTEQLEDTSALLSKIKPILGKDIDYRRTEVIGPKMGQELIINGCYAILCALIGIMVYVWARFEWQFSLCAFIALFHDCLAILTFFMLFKIEFNEGAVVAILITASYSINDTVVIFDRLRENRKHKRGMPFADMLNLSLNETLSRTLLTSSTTLLALIMLYFFGGEVIASFSFPIFVGILIGTYSSIVIAVPLLQWFPFSDIKKLTF